jgi:transposase
MEYGAIDLHLRRSVVRIIKEDETVGLERRIETTREALNRVFAGRARLRILIESGTESEWVAQHLEGLGHEVVVGDPNYLPMYGARARKVKTDGRDVAALAIANRRGVYRRAPRVSAATRALRQRLRIRRHLVQVRSGLISLLRSVLRQEGYRLPSGSADRVSARLDRLELPAALVAVLQPVRDTIAQLTATLTRLDTEVETRAATDAVAQRLMTAPGVGPVLALTFRAVLDDPARFGGEAARASAFVGLVPREDSSDERRHKGHITKTGPRDLRAVLVQASWTIWRGRSAAGAGLRAWAHALAARRGRRIAIIALARRLTRILYAMWRDQREFVPRGAAVPAAA